MTETVAGADGATRTTTTTTTTTQANPYTFKLTEVIAGGEPDAVFDFYAGSWVGPELE